MTEITAQQALKLLDIKLAQFERELRETLSDIGLSKIQAGPLRFDEGVLFMGTTPLLSAPPEQRTAGAKHLEKLVVAVMQYVLNRLKDGLPV